VEINQKIASTTTTVIKIGMHAIIKEGENTQPFVG